MSHVHVLMLISWSADAENEKYGALGTSLAQLASAAWTSFSVAEWHSSARKLRRCQFRYLVVSTGSSYAWAPRPLSCSISASKEEKIQQSVPINKKDGVEPFQSERPVIYEHPVVLPHVSHLRHVPLRTRVKLPQSPQASPS